MGGDGWAATLRRGGLMVFDDGRRKAWLVWRGEEDQLW